MENPRRTDPNCPDFWAEHDAHDLAADTAFEEIMTEALTAEAKTSLGKLGSHPDGVRYLQDEGTVSWYAVRVKGTDVMHVSVDNSRPLWAFESPTNMHGIWVWRVDHSHHVSTGGVAARIKHSDGSGVHVNGYDVRSYVLPRIASLLARLA